MTTNGSDPRVQELSVEVAVLKARLDAKEEALGLQAKEYERRLHDLNDAHRLARDTLITYLPREIFEKQIAGWDDWRRIVDSDRSTNAGSKAMLAAIVSIFLSLASLVGVFLYRWHS